MHRLQFGTRFGASCSQHPIPSVAVGEVVGDTLESVGPEADLVIVAMTPDLTGTFDDVVGVVRSVLQPRSLVATTASTVFSNDTAITERQGISVWAGRFGHATSIRFEADDADDADGAAGPSTTGLERWADDLDSSAATASAMLLVADPFSFACGEWVSIARRRWPHLTLIGGASSAPRKPGGSRLATDDRTCTNGAVGALLYTVPPPATRVVLGSTPVGPHFIVTRAERQVVYELNGSPAKSVFDAMVTALAAPDRAPLRNAIYLGMIIQPGPPDSAPTIPDEPGTRLPEMTQVQLHEVRGFDPRTGALALDGDVNVDVGATIGFFTRTADAMVRELTHAAITDGPGRLVRASLLFTSSGPRHRTAFAERESAEALFETTGAPVGGFGCSLLFAGPSETPRTIGAGTGVTLFG